MLSYKQHRLKDIYDALPVAAQHAMTSLYGLRHRQRVRGSYYRAGLAHLQESQWYARERVEELQDAQLRGFVQYAYAHSPFWRRVFQASRLTPEQIRTQADLRRLPLLEKETLRASVDEITSDEFASGKEKSIVAQTSGTTGTALRLKISVEAWQREYAFRDHHRSWMGIRDCDRTATFAGHPVVAASDLRPPYWRRNLAENQILFSAQHITPATLPRYAEELTRFQPRFVHGYPSALYLVALYMDANSVRSVRPHALYTHSETLFDYQRELLTRVFQCRVFNGYGNTERVAQIVECERGSLHVQMEHGLIEFLRLDGSVARPGELAEMVCTGFGNRATPLIRYRTGDLAIYSERTCTCGRNGTVVEQIIGRLDDIIVTPDGRHVGRLDHVFKEATNVIEAQIIQETVDAVRVRLVAGSGFDESDAGLIERELRARLGDRIKIEYEFLERIPREPNGKFRAVLSKVPVEVGAARDSSLAASSHSAAENEG